MATASMATAAGAAALLYYTLNRKLHTDASGLVEDELGTHANNSVPLGIERVSNRPIRAPATWLETISTLSETLRFTYSETLGKWPIGDLAFGINFLLKRQGNLQVESVFGGTDSVLLKGPEIVAELKHLLNLLTLCWHFSKKPFPLFLEETGYSSEEVLIQEPKAGILKPAFTILVDHKTKHFLLLIRGTHSIKDTLTAVTGAVVPFHHTIVHEGGVRNLVLGYAHCGMVAAARWIAKLARPCLLKALSEHPDYQLKIVGHSLGGGTAALLTYILREQNELSEASCVAFAPAACMTWELADSGADFIISVINGADMVPTFSVATVDDLRAEVTASAWLNDLRVQIEQTRILSTVYRSASALSSRLPSIASARAKVAGAGAVLRPVSNGTQAVMRRAQTMAHAAWTRPSLQFSSWSCIGPRHRKNVEQAIDGENSRNKSSTKSDASKPLISAASTTATTIDDFDLHLSISHGSQWSSKAAECSYPDSVSVHDEMDTRVADGEDLVDHNGSIDHLIDVELWQEIEHELADRGEGEERADVEQEIREEEAAVIAEAGGGGRVSQQDGLRLKMNEVHRFFPAGRILHIIPFHETEAEDNDDSASAERPSKMEDENRPSCEGKVGIFLTPRSLYSKLRLSQRMVSDHFMPVYRRQIEKLIRDLEME